MNTCEYKIERSDIPDDIELVEYMFNSYFWELISVVPDRESNLYCYWFKRETDKSPYDINPYSEE